ncbi:MAG TPA: universal stress protein [Polyangia bacterium]|nr:universal stress protein [Polyangia bacterium]
MPFRRVLIATDFSEYSDEAARCGLKVAEAFGGEVMFLHVFDVRHLPIISAYPYYYGQVNQQMVDDMRARGEEALAAFVKRHVGERPAERRMVSGAPALQILEQATAWGADLIVIGSRGSGRVHELLGSVVHKVVREARCPVLAVPQPTADEKV